METAVTPNRGSGDRAEFLTDGVLNLYNIRKNRQNHRAIEVIKMRDTDHSGEIKLFSVEKNGLKNEYTCDITLLKKRIKNLQTTDFFESLRELYSYYKSIRGSLDLSRL